MVERIKPHKITREIFGCNPEDISERVILSQHLMEGLKKRTKILKEFEGFLNGYTGRYKKQVFSAIGLKGQVGSPVASDSVYFLRFTPCKNIVYKGAIGALKEDIEIGDVILPTVAIRGEGASKYHAPEWYPAISSFELLRKAAPMVEEALSKLGAHVHYGIIYTTDSFAAETTEFLQDLQEKHVIGIDMETSGIFTMANLQAMNAIAIHVVSDNPIAEKSCFELSQDDTNKLKASTQALLEAILGIVAEI